MFYLLIGAAGAGKSTWAKEFAKANSTLIVSSDSIREELWGDERVQKDPNKVFEIAHERIIEGLGSDKYDHVIFDATNLKRKHRAALMKKIKEFECEKIYILFIEPYEVLCKRNNSRARNVPEEVIWEMIRRFETPLPSEGYTDIQIVNNVPVNLYKVLCTMENFDQQNPHHSDTLLTHCQKATKYVESFRDSAGMDKEILKTAALLHDIGKPLTKTFVDYKGNRTKEAHYYNHENVGAYLSLMAEIGWTKEERLLISRLICYHMLPYSIKSTKALDKWKTIFGEDLFKKIIIIHAADKLSH